MIQATNRVLVSGHRGASSLAPENTMASLDLAAKFGVDMVSIDVRRTQDGHLVVLHDATVDRTTNGHGAVKDLTLAAVRGLDAGGKKGPTFAGERVPTFDEALYWSNRTNVKLEVEIKDPKIYPGIEDEALASIRRHKAESNMLVDSFDHDSMRKFKRSAPDIQVGYLVSASPVWKAVGVGAAVGAAAGLAAGAVGGSAVWLALGGSAVGGLLAGHRAKRRAFADSLKDRPDVVLPNYSLVSKGWVKRFHAQGSKVIPYTEDAPALVRRLKNCQVDGIITDTPQRYASSK